MLRVYIILSYSMSRSRRLDKYLVPHTRYTNIGGMIHSNKITACGKLPIIHTAAI